MSQELPTPEGIKREIEGVKETAAHYDAVLKDAIKTGQTQGAEELQKDIEARIAGLREKLEIINDPYQIELRDRIAKEKVMVGWAFLTKELQRHENLVMPLGALLTPPESR